HAQNLEHHGHAHEGGVARRIEGRRDFHDIAADEVQAAQAAEQLLRLVAAGAADLGRAGAGRIHGVEEVDVEAHVSGPVAHHATGLGDDLLDAHPEVLVDVDHPDALP